VQILLDKVGSSSGTSRVHAATQSKLMDLGGDCGRDTDCGRTSSSDTNRNTSVQSAAMDQLGSRLGTSEANILRQSERSNCDGTNSAQRGHKKMLGLSQSRVLPLLNKGDHPEMNASKELDQEGIAQHQPLTGAMQWAISHGRKVHCCSACLVHSVKPQAGVLLSPVSSPCSSSSRLAPLGSNNIFRRSRVATKIV
jgi:hypothetical protein